jgi:hypothetical protein
LDCHRLSPRIAVLLGHWYPHSLIPGTTVVSAS